MKTTVVVALGIALAGCANGPAIEPRMALAKPFTEDGDPNVACTTGTGTKDPIHGKYTVEWGYEILEEDHDHLLVAGETIDIERSADAGFACVTVTKLDTSKSFSRRLALAPAEPDGKVYALKHTHTDTDGNRYDYRMRVFPKSGTCKEYAAGSFFYDDAMSGDSGGTWGGGK